MTSGCATQSAAASIQEISSRSQPNGRGRHGQMIFENLQNEPNIVGAVNFGSPA